MTILLQKGSAFNAEYTSTDYPTLSADWTGSVSFYKVYPGTATFTKALVRVGNAMTLSLTIAEITNLDAGLYSLGSDITNSVLGVTISSLDYATVTTVNLSAATKCKIFGTLENIDGSPIGRETKTLANTTGGLSLQLGWEGVGVTANNGIADNDPANPLLVIGLSQVSTTTNAAGYFELYVIQGLVYSVSCGVFGKVLTIDTTGLTEKDISSYF
jgi:hypothetical protein